MHSFMKVLTSGRVLNPKQKYKKNYIIDFKMAINVSVNYYDFGALLQNSCLDFKQDFE